MLITPDIEQIIKLNVILKQYPKLNLIHKELLYKYFSKVVEVFLLVNNYNTSNKDAYLHEFIQNDSQSLRWLCSFLLPYIDVPTNNITSFDEIYTKKSTSITSSSLTDIGPTYIYSNIQYGRCIRGDTPIELLFDDEHLRQNALLLCSSIIESSNKLYTNWMDLMPYTMDNYMKSDLYKNTNNIIEGNTLQDTITDVLFEKISSSTLTDSDKKVFGSIYIGDIYMCVRNYLYEDIKNIKLLIYDMGLDGYSDRIFPSIIILFKIMPIFIKNALNNIHYHKLTLLEQETIETEF